MAMILSCQKIEEAINEKKEQAQELTDKAKNDALGIIQQGKDDIKEKKDALTK
jgi:vacuolar-type H+-ATPase subunit H